MIEIDKIIELVKPDAGKFKVNSLESAYKFCETLTKSHYENFPVASILVKKEQRKFIYAIYSFARLADDIADDFPDISQRVNLLDKIRNYLTSKNLTNHPIFLALYDTLKVCEIPDSPLLKLLYAFETDAKFTQPETWQDLLDYCDNSANPVGELILRVTGEYNKTNILFSNSICTGLQLANFWQDFSRDLPNARFYIPTELLHKHQLSIKDLKTDNKVKTQELLDELHQRTHDIFTHGERLLVLINSVRLRYELAITLNGGRLILKKSKKLGVNIFTTRPKLKKTDFILVILQSLV